jgi:hypothetical protein
MRKAAAMGRKTSAMFTFCPAQNPSGDIKRSFVYSMTEKSILEIGEGFD